MHCLLNIMCVFGMDTVHIHFKILLVCVYIYRICSDRTRGKYEYGTILQLIIQLIHFTVCSCIYRICSDRTWGKYECWTILQLITELIYFIHSFYFHFEDPYRNRKSIWTWKQWLVQSFIHSLIQSFPHFRYSWSYSRIYLLKMIQYHIITPTDTNTSLKQHTAHIITEKRHRQPGNLSSSSTVNFKTIKRKTCTSP
jgi:hypothetical protein